MAYGTPMQNQNKGYAKQERKDLMNDNPIAKDASGGRSWMSKHSQSRFGSSPLQQKEETYDERQARKAKEKKKERLQGWQKYKRKEKLGMQQTLTSQNQNHKLNYKL